MFRNVNQNTKKTFMKFVPLLFLSFFSSAQTISNSPEKPFLIPQQTKDLNIAVMNYDNLSEVSKLKKFELGVKLPDSILTRVNAFLYRTRMEESRKINPFLEWNLDVEATFIHPESNSTMVVNGFYYRNYERNITKNDWDPIKTDFPMRIRFAPPQTGVWQCLVTLKVNGQLIATEPLFQFNVVDIEAPGFVKVHSNNKNFERDGQLILPIGQNFPAPEEGVATYHNLVTPELPPNETNKAAPLSSWLAYHKSIVDYFEAGGKYIRSVQAAYSSLIEFEEKGNYFNRLHYAWEQDYVLENCEKHEALLLFNLMNQEPLMNFGNYYFYDWDWGNFNYDGQHDPNGKYPVYCYNDNPGVKQPHEMFLNESDLRYHEQRTRYYISRYGYSTAIYQFELMNEPFHLGQFWKEGTSSEPLIDRSNPLHEITLQAVNNYHRRMSTYIKKGLAHTDHLIGVNTTFQELKPDGSGVVDSSLTHPDIDIINMNCYGLFPNKLIVSKSGKAGNNGFDANENSYARVIFDLQTSYHKPVIISEGGPSEEYSGCSNFCDMGIDNHTLQFCGLAAYAFWNGFRSTEHSIWDKTILGSLETKELIIPFLELANGSYIQGRQKAPISKKDKQEIKETQYFITEDKSSAVGYVRNRSYNFFTNKTGGICDIPNFESENTPVGTKTDIMWQEGPKRYRLEIEGLKPKSIYTIEWFSDAVSIGKWKLETNRKGTSDLQYPELSVTEGKPLRPVLLFRVTP